MYLKSAVVNNICKEPPDETRWGGSGRKQMSKMLFKDTIILSILTDTLSSQSTHQGKDNAEGIRGEDVSFSEVMFL